MFESHSSIQASKPVGANHFCQSHNVRASSKSISRIYFQQTATVGPGPPFAHTVTSWRGRLERTSRPCSVTSSVSM